jgi:hypothetical protein
MIFIRAFTCSAVGFREERSRNVVAECELLGRSGHSATLPGSSLTGANMTFPSAYETQGESQYKIRESQDHFPGSGSGLFHSGGGPSYRDHHMGAT